MNNTYLLSINHSKSKAHTYYQIFEMKCLLKRILFKLHLKSVQFIDPP